MSEQKIFEVTINETGVTYRCRSDESLLHGMERLGKRGIPSGCRGGGCGVCKVEVVCGDYVARTMSCDHVSDDDRCHHRLLACKVYPTSDVTVEVIGKMRKNVCR